MNESHLHNDTNATNERLAKAFYANGRYNPLFLGVAGAGFIVIFLLTQFHILGEPAVQLLYVGTTTLLFAVFQVVPLALAQQGKGIAANVYSSIATGIFAIVLSLFWQGIVLIPILIAVVTPLMAFRHGMPRKYIWPFFLLIAVILAGIVYANAHPPLDGLQNGSIAATASIVFVGATVLLLLTITTVSSNNRFRSLQSSLVISFLIIVAIPTIMTAVLTAVGAYTNTQTQTFNTLEAITTLKINQIRTLLADSRNDTETLLADPRFTANALDVLSGASVSPTIQQSFKRVARSRMVDVLGAEEEAYNEIMVLDKQGNVTISTIPKREGMSFADQAFFKQGVLGFYAGFAQEPSFGTENLIIATPIFDVTGQNIQGVLILRSNAAFMRTIMENTPGFSQAETYLVNDQFNPVTKTRTPVNSIKSKAVLEAVQNKVSGTKGIYPSYSNQQVLGYYEWFSPMQLAVIAEVPLSFAVGSSLHALAGSAVLTLFIVAVAIIAVVISARTIADPITILARTTESFATGKLSARAVVDRNDEIGALAKAYNQMATQLQDMIGKLEQRVANRTQDLETQTLRLRVAAEIARDAASARELDDLLTQASQLICSRFGFYHAGIFLLDSNKEYAVLVASPTEPGKKMIEHNHRLRVGETGIVGRVAATGEPRVTLNTGMDAVYFNNPYLPNTHSEMALPLKVENNVIGVLDVQSDQPQAFNDDDVAIMQILADQLATAIERTLLLEQVERSLKELESASGRFTRENWRKVSAGRFMSTKGYRFDNIRIESITELPELADAVLKSGTMINSNGSDPRGEHQVAIPVKLRGQTIGVVNLKLKEGYDSSTLSVIELATERLAAAMESARLYEEARLRADREQSISQVTTAISASTEYEQILQTTVKEVGNVLGDAEVTIQILEEPAQPKQVEKREQ